MIWVDLGYDFHHFWRYKLRWARAGAQKIHNTFTKSVFFYRHLSSIYLSIQLNSISKSCAKLSGKIEIIWALFAYKKKIVKSDLWNKINRERLGPGCLRSWRAGRKLLLLWLLKNSHYLFILNIHLFCVLHYGSHPVTICRRRRAADRALG